MTELQQGLLRYHKQNFSAAFIIFRKLAEENDITAQYMLSNMYNRGEGTPVDRERAEFWMKKAADNGDPVAQFDFAVFQLSDPNRDTKKTNLGREYLGRSAAQGHKDAMDRYIDLVQKNSRDAKELKTARSCCTKLMAQSEDSYDKQHYAQIRRSLGPRLRKVKRLRFGETASSFLSVIGALIVMFATILLFTTCHKDFLLTIPTFRQLPQPVWMLLFFDWINVPNLIRGGTMYMDSADFLVLLVGFGWLLKGASHKESRNLFATVIVRIGIVLRYVTIIGHLILCSVLDTAPLDPYQQTLLGLGMVIIAARIIGWVLGKILGTKVDWSKIKI